MSTPVAPDASVVIDRIDHLVLTVADLDQTIDFYVRVLGMQPVTFGAGRRTLRFGRHQLNLHQAGRELEPKARRPTPGSADVCLVTTTRLLESWPTCRPARWRLNMGRWPGPGDRPDHLGLCS